MSRKELLLLLLLVALLVIFCIILIITVFFPSVLPLDPQLTVDALSEVTQQKEILAKIGNKYYGSTPSLSFNSCFYFSSWELMDEVRKGQPEITLEFEEKWIMEIFGDGLGYYANVYNGYARSGTRSAVTYRIPLSVINLLTYYFENQGIPHYIGDGSIGLGSFQH